MKIRNGFVSNSSTSSFLIYGIALEDDEIRKSLGIKEFDDEVDLYDIEDDLYEMIDEAFQKEKLKAYQWHHPYDGEDGWYIGRSWSSVGDDETGSQFRESIEKDLKTIFGDKVEFGTHKAAWRDG